MHNWDLRVTVHAVQGATVVDEKFPRGAVDVFLQEERPAKPALQTVDEVLPLHHARAEWYHRQGDKDDHGRERKLHFSFSASTKL